MFLSLCTAISRKRKDLYLPMRDDTYINRQTDIVSNATTSSNICWTSTLVSNILFIFEYETHILMKNKHNINNIAEC